MPIFSLKVIPRRSQYLSLNGVYLNIAIHIVTVHAKLQILFLFKFVIFFFKIMYFLVSEFCLKIRTIVFRIFENM